MVVPRDFFGRLRLAWLLAPDDIERAVGAVLLMSFLVELVEEAAAPRSEAPGHERVDSFGKHVRS